MKIIKSKSSINCLKNYTIKSSTLMTTKGSSLVGEQGITQAYNFNLRIFSII